MSQTTATATSGLRVPRRAPESRRPQLRVVTAEPSAPRQLPFVLLCSFLLSAGLLALLLLNTSLASDAYELHTLQTTSDRLTEDETTAREALNRVSSAQSLGVAAWKLGMTPLGQPPLTVDLATGKVRGLERSVDPGVTGEAPFSVVQSPVYARPAAKDAKGAKAEHAKAKTAEGPATAGAPDKPAPPDKPGTP